MTADIVQPAIFNEIETRLSSANSGARSPAKHLRNSPSFLLVWIVANLQSGDLQRLSRRCERDEQQRHIAVAAAPVLTRRHEGMVNVGVGHRARAERTLGLVMRERFQGGVLSRACRPRRVLRPH